MYADKQHYFLSDFYTDYTVPVSTSFSTHIPIPIPSTVKNEIFQCLTGTSNRSTWHSKEEYENMEKQQRVIQTRRVLSLRERIDVIQAAESQHKRDTKLLSRMFDCGRTQILSILQQKDRLIREWINDGDPNRLRRRPSSFAVAINKIVAEWVERCRRAHLPLTDSMIIDKAYQGKKFFKYGDFRPNRRWLDRFKRRFRLDGIDLTSPDFTFGSVPDTSRSLKISEIYEDIKETLDSSIIETMSDRKGTTDFANFLALEGTSNSITDPNLSYSIQDQTMSSNNDISDPDVAYDDGLIDWQPENFYEAAIEEQGTDSIKDEQATESIKDDVQALEYIKKLEEYSMLKDNYRAIGLIDQLEKLFKGQIEA